MPLFSPPSVVISPFINSPSGAHWEKLFRQTSAGFRWGLKVPEQITVPVWPMHPRYGAQAGRENPAFLDHALLQQAFLDALAPWRAQVGVLIFEFGRMQHAAISSVADFVNALDPFLDRLPPGWHCAVEVRNPEFLAPGYFACLRAHGVSHVYNALDAHAGDCGSNGDSGVADRAALAGGARATSPYGGVLTKDAVGEIFPLTARCGK